MEETKNETLDLSRRGLKKIEKAPPEESKTIITLVLDQNELQRLDNIETYNRIENLSICNNFLVRMHGVSRLVNIRVLALNNNGILQIEGLKDLIYLKVLKLAGNNIKSIEHLNHNMHLEHLDLSNNQISFIADISYLKSLKHLNLERNRIMDLRQCDRYLPTALEHFGLAHNNIQDLNEICHLVHLSKLESFSIQGNPCISLAGKDKLGFDYRPFVLNWIMSVKSIDGFIVSAIESLKAEWLYSQGKGRHFHEGQHRELCEYLASTCPLTADALETEDQRKLRLILSKAQHHQQQLKDHNHSPMKSKIQSPRMQSRMPTRHMGRSPDRLSSSYHAAIRTGSPLLSNSSEPIPHAMSQSYDSPGLMYERRDRSEKAVTEQQPAKPVNQSLEAASKMVPVPESLMSPDYQDPIFDIQRSIPKPNHTNNISNTSSQSSNSSIQDDRQRTNKSFKGSPKLPKSANSSPKLKSKIERKGSLTKSDIKNVEKKLNGMTNNKEMDQIDPEKLEVIKLASNQRRQKKMSVESMAAVTIQKMWRGYRSRNLNKDTLRILHAIQAARARQHIQRLTCDMEATKAALESERKIQQLQMQAINALWKKVSTLQNSGTRQSIRALQSVSLLKDDVLINLSLKSDFEDRQEHTNNTLTYVLWFLLSHLSLIQELGITSKNIQKSKTFDPEDSSDVLRQLTETCFNLQAQVVELQSSMQEVLRAVSQRSRSEPVATQTDISALLTPQEERCTWLRRPQSLALPTNASTPPSGDRMCDKTNDSVALDIERTESIIDDRGDATIENSQTERERSLIVD